MKRPIFAILAALLLVMIVFVSPSFQQRVVLLTSPVLHAGQGAASILGAPLRLLQGIGALRDDFQNLQNEVVRLRVHVSDLEIARRENDILREQLGAPASDRFDFNILATVIGRDPVGGLLTMTVNAGRSDGVRENNPVVAPGGILVGRVISAGNFASIVQLLTHPESRIDVRILPANVRGMMQSHGGFLSIDVLPQRFAFSSDESVVTTGADDFYPAGLYLGRLGEVLSEEVDVFERRRLNNDNIIDSLTEVFILANDLQ